MGRSVQRPDPPGESSCSSRIPGSQSDAVLGAARLAVEGLGWLLLRGEHGDAHHLHDRPGGCRGGVGPPAARTIRCAGQAAATLAGRRRGRPLRCARDGHRRVLLEDPQPDVLDLVAQRGGALELELLGRLAHLRLHPHDERLDLLAVRLVEARPDAPRSEV